MKKLLFILFIILVVSCYRTPEIKVGQVWTDSNTSLHITWYHTVLSVSNNFVLYETKNNYDTIITIDSLDYYWFKKWYTLYKDGKNNEKKERY